MCEPLMCSFVVQERIFKKKFGTIQGYVVRENITYAIVLVLEKLTEVELNHLTIVKYIPPRWNA